MSPLHQTSEGVAVHESVSPRRRPQADARHQRYVQRACGPGSLGRYT